MSQSLPPRSNKPSGVSRAESSAAVSHRRDMSFVVPVTSVRTLEVDGIRVFYREAGPADGAVLLLLDGVPASSFLFPELIPRPSGRYRLLGADPPRFGLTGV